MKQVGSDTYNIAWFKLADCIARGEKERALGVYRLLSHSFDDHALACQLHADILRLFNDERAQGEYVKAAQLYRERNKTIEAAAVYEHLMALDPQNTDYALELIALYQQVGIGSKVMQYVQSLVHDLLKHNEWKQAIEVVQQYDTVGDASFMATLHEQLLFYLAPKDDVLLDTMMVHAKKALDAWIELHNQQAITKLLSTVKAVNEKLHEYVRGYVTRER